MADRDIVKIIGLVIAEVPKDYRGKTSKLDTVARLRSLQRDCAYTAPEDMRRRWIQLMLICREDLGDPANETERPWLEKICRIVEDKEPTA